MYDTLRGDVDLRLDIYAYIRDYIPKDGEEWIKPAGVDMERIGSMTEKYSISMTLI